MKPLLIHIGYHKTGTTWLQDNLFYQGHESFDPVCGDPKKLGKSFFMNSISKADLSPYDDNQKIIQQEWSLYLKERGESSEKVSVISCERLSGNLHEGGYDSSITARRINKNFPNAKIFIVIREQNSFILSSYFQYLKAGGNLDLEKYLFDRRPGFSFDHARFLELIKDYHDLFGQENVHVLPYELFVKDPMAFFKSLEDFVESKISIDPEQFTVRSNAQQHTYLFYHLRRLGIFLRSNSLNNQSRWYSPKTRAFVFKGYDLMGKMGFDRLNTKLKKKLAQKIDNIVGDRYQESNVELSRLIGIDLSQYGYQIKAIDSSPNNPSTI